LVTFSIDAHHKRDMIGIPRREDFMRKLANVSLLLVLVPALAAAQSSSAAGADIGRTIITATGTARESFLPDKVTILVTLEAQGMTADDASSRITALERAVVDTLRKTVGNRGNMVSIGYGVAPYRNANGPAAMMGGAAFVGRGVIRVELDHAEDLNRVTSAAAAKGGSPTGNPAYSSSAADSIRRIAMAKAFEQARGDAEALARAAGGRLGRLVESSSTNPGNAYLDAIANQPLFISAYGYDTGPRAVPTSTVTATVTTKWELIH
jgi:uncharacterized protein YggE